MAPDMRARSLSAVKLRVNEAATTMRLRMTAVATLAVFVAASVVLRGWVGSDIDQQLHFCWSSVLVVLQSPPGPLRISSASFRS